MQAKNNEAPFACNARSSQPLFTSRAIWATEEKARSVCGV